MITFVQAYQQALLQDIDPVRKIQLHSQSAGLEATSNALGIPVNHLIAINAVRHSVNHQAALALYQQHTR